MTTVNWISVDERLPPQKHVVMVWISHGEAYQIAYQDRDDDMCGADGWVTWDDHGPYAGSEVSHWRELPSPPPGFKRGSHIP